MLAILDGWLRIVNDGPASGRDELVGPPVVGDDIHDPSLFEKLFGRTIKHQRISPSDALHQGVLKVRRSPKQGRMAAKFPFYINEFDPAAIEGRAGRGAFCRKVRARFSLSGFQMSSWSQ